MKKVPFKLWLLFIGLIAFSSFINMDDVGEGYQIGDVVSDFSLKNVDGQKVSLSDFKDAKGFIVIFTCNTCPYSVASEDRINALNAEFKSKGFPVIAINPNNPNLQPADSYKAMQQKSVEKGFTFPYLYDESHTIHAIFGAKKTPHSFVLKKESNQLIVKYIGAIDDNVRDGDRVKKRFLAEAVIELLQGKEVTLTETKAIGCGVKA